MTPRVVSARGGGGDRVNRMATKAKPAKAHPRRNGKAEPPNLDHITEGLRDKAYPLADLAFMVGNAVKHPDKQIEEIKASLERFGQVEALVVNKRPTPPVVIGGNGRLQALLSLGKTHAAVVFVDLDEASANTLSLALNRTADGREWDKDALDKMLREVSTGGDERLDQMMASLAEEVGIVPPEGVDEAIREMRIKPPPEMVWVLVGIPLDHFGTVRDHLVAIQENASVTVQSNRD